MWIILYVISTGITNFASHSFQTQKPPEKQGVNPQLVWKFFHAHAAKLCLFNPASSQAAYLPTFFSVGSLHHGLDSCLTLSVLKVPKIKHRASYFLSS